MLASSWLNISLWKRASTFTLTRTTLSSWTQPILVRHSEKNHPRPLTSMLTPGSTCQSQLSGCGWWNLMVLIIEDLPTADLPFRRSPSRGGFRFVLLKKYSLWLIWFSIRTSWLALQRTSILKLDPASIKSYLYSMLTCWMVKKLKWVWEFGKVGSWGDLGGSQGWGGAGIGWYWDID